MLLLLVSILRTGADLVCFKCFIFFFIIQGATIHSLAFVGNEFGDIVKYFLQNICSIFKEK